MDEETHRAGHKTALCRMKTPMVLKQGLSILHTLHKCAFMPQKPLYSEYECSRLVA